MITNIDAAEDAFNAAECDVLADMGDMEGETPWHDIVVSVAFDCDDATALELCRTKLGHVPHELEQRLGKHDFIDGSAADRDLGNYLAAWTR